MVANVESLRQARFVGRDREMTVLQQALELGPAVVLIEGEAGIGKSRLLREFLDHQGPGSLVAACPPVRQPYTLGPIVDAARQAGPPDGLSELAGALRPLFPEWSAALPPALEPLGDPHAARHQLFRALMDLLAHLGVRVLVIEDVHWADETTLEFLLFLADRQPQPVSLVVTFRPEDIVDGSLLPRLTSRAARTRLTLAPLDVAETRVVVSSMLSDEPLSDTFAAFVYEHTDGVPLAIEETVRLMHARADLTLRDGRWLRRQVSDIHVPPTVRDAVLERSGRLCAPARAVLGAVAVLTDPADDAILAAVTGLPADDVVAGLTEGLACGLLADDRRGVTFRHALAARAVYEAIPAPHRRALHLRAGRVLESVSPQPVAALARHFREAGDSIAWCRYGERAADIASVSGDDGAAAAIRYELVTRAQLPAADLVRLAGGISFAALSGRSRLHDLCRSLRRALVPGLDESVEGGLRLQLGRVLSAMDDRGASRHELERAVSQLHDEPVLAFRAMMHLAFPNVSGDHDIAAQWLRRAERLADTLPIERLRFLVDRAAILAEFGDPGVWSAAAQLPDDADSAADRAQIARGNLNVGDGAIVWGRYAEARERLERASRLAERHQYQRVQEMALAHLLMLDWCTGAWDGLAERAAALAEDHDLHPLTRMEAVLVSGLLAAARGANPVAEAALLTALREYRVHADLNSMTCAGELARMWLAAGRVDDALEVTRPEMEVVAASGNWLPATDLVPPRVEALLAAGRREQAGELADAFERGLRGHEAPGPQAGLALVRALLAPRGAHAATLFEAAAARWSALPRPYDALLARERQAGCLIEAGRHDDGLSLLSAVRGGLSEIGATLAAERVARTLHDRDATGSHVWRGGRRGYGDRLSPRELEVVRLVIAGRTNREIADALHRSPKTVANQLNSAMRKLQVTSRTALAVKAVEIGETGDRGD